MHDKVLRSPLPFSDLGFDHLMRDRRICDAFNAIDNVTSTDCVVHMGHPLWCAIYDSSDNLNRETLLDFAVTKLLLLSQRLALDINSSAYITSGSTRNYVMADKIQLQITNYMRVCIGTPDNLVAVRGVAASEPILSEAASCIMRGNYDFHLSDALFNVLDLYAISHGDRGESLVASFLTRVRDLYVRRIPPEKLFPNVLTQICPIFSVKDLLLELSQEADFSTMLDSLPSICRADFSSQKFGDVFKRTKIHFNHMIKPFEQEVLTRLCLLAMMARGAAAFGANGQFGCDTVYHFLYETNDLDVKKVGFIIIQVKNHADRLAPNPTLFKKMNPFSL
ncbi:hypothetical protein EDB87DRAFT_1392354 [Lactarius vividus]|nr:hypothetical protein EDB87DRAFT_1392354 [Lactarius vividus]